MAFCTQADLERALGGADKLAQLSDPNRTGSPDAVTVTDYLETGAAEIRTATEIKHEPETLANLDAGSLTRLRDANAAISARAAYDKGGVGLAMPEWIRERAERADKFLDQLATGYRRLGRVAGGNQSAINQPAQGSVDFDPLLRGISIGAFKIGFR